MTATPGFAYKQFLFDNALFGVRRQDGPSMRMLKVAGINGTYPACGYRSMDGKSRCAVGWNIEDGEYYDAMEGKAINPLSTFVPPRLQPYCEFLRKLQTAHDSPARAFTYDSMDRGQTYAKAKYMLAFNEAMRMVAKEENLIYTEDDRGIHYANAASDSPYLKAEMVEATGLVVGAN
jgi:hypothetical protein